jgi:hypothetical protein
MSSASCVSASLRRSELPGWKCMSWAQGSPCPAVAWRTPSQRTDYPAVAQGLLHAVGAVYSLIYEGQNGGPAGGCRGGRRSGRGQLRAAARPAAPGGLPDGAGSRCISPCGVCAGAACRTTGHAGDCPPLPPSLTCPDSQGPSTSRAAIRRTHMCQDGVGLTGALYGNTTDLRRLPCDLVRCRVAGVSACSGSLGYGSVPRLPRGPRCPRAVVGPSLGAVGLQIGITCGG